MKNNLILQSFILVGVVLISLSFTRIDFSSGSPVEDRRDVVLAEVGQQVDPYLHFQRVLSSFSSNENNSLRRNWEVVDPEVNSQAVMFQFFDEEEPIFYRNTYRLWPAASITKLMTALVVIENIGLNKKIFIDQETAAGSRGVLRSGEVYTSRELVKVMLVSSNNSTAIAFENHLGREEFLNLMNQKARTLKMDQTVYFDASGLSEDNLTSARDVMILLRYISETRPEILNWTRLSNFIFRPINLNYVENKTVFSNNPFVDDSRFIGGKTGTLPRSGQNFAGIFTFENYRVAIVVLGSSNRVLEIERLFDWARRAYDLE